MKTKAPAPVNFEDVSVCPRCRAELLGAGDAYECTGCGSSYPLVSGVLDLLVEPEDERGRRYIASYDRVARADLEQPFEHDRNERHDVLLRFIGDVRGKSVLDVGSSDAAYLLKLNAGVKVATDLAAPFLDAIPKESGIVRIRADAEVLPFAPGAFDVVVLSDVLEHVLHPEEVVARLTAIVRPDTRVIVHVPWEESLASYADSEYEFTHLRSFTHYTFSRLWHKYRIVRERATYPALEEPFVFQIRRFVPLWLYNLLSWHYFHGGYSHKEYAMRARWIAELPSRERRLLRLYRPLFRMFELRILAVRSGAGGYEPPLPRQVAWLTSMLRRIRRRRPSS